MIDEKEELKKEKQRLAVRKHYQKNSEVLRQKRKEYYYKNAEQERQKRREYYKNNPDKAKEYNIKYREQNKDKLKEYDKEHYSKNAEKKREYSKKYYSENKEHYKELSVIYREENKEFLNAYKKDYYYNNKDKRKVWREKNKDKINKQQNEYQKTKKLVDNNYKIKCTIMGSFNSGLKKQLIKKSMSMLSYTGIKYSEYVEHFKNDPLWNDYCSGKNIHVDHIIPVSAYNLTNKEEIKKCWHYRNLRLLDAFENMSKKDKIDYDLIKQYGIEDLLPCA